MNPLTLPQPPLPGGTYLNRIQRPGPVVAILPNGEVRSCQLLPPDRRQLPFPWPCFVSVKGHVIHGACSQDGHGRFTFAPDPSSPWKRLALEPLQI